MLFLPSSIIPTCFGWMPPLFSAVSGLTFLALRLVPAALVRPLGFFVPFDSRPKQEYDISFFIFLPGTNTRFGL